MVKIACFIMIFSLLSCRVTSLGSLGPTDLDRVSDQVIVNFAKKMKPRGLHACGIGGRENKGKIEWLEVVFQYDEMLELAKARQLIIEITQLFVDEINNDQQIKPYLYHHPFTTSDVVIGILPNYNKIERGNWSNFVRVDLNSGVLSYYDDSNFNETWVYLKKETFEEAVEIVKRAEDDEIGGSLKICF